VDVDPKELIAARCSKSFPPSFVFGESKVTTNLIREYEAAGFFPAGDGRATLDEQIPTPEADEVVVFRDFFTCGLRFPCNPLCACNSGQVFCENSSTITEFISGLSKFFWVMKTFRCNFSADLFARLFELVIEPDILKLDDGQYYEEHYMCCTFNTRRQNTRKGHTRI
jgi:hypothetical protein